MYLIDFLSWDLEYLFVRIVEILNWLEVVHTRENVHWMELLTWVTS